MPYVGVSGLITPICRYWTEKGLTLNQLVEGSSPSRVIVAKLRFAYGRTGCISPFSIYLITHVPLDMHVERCFYMLWFENRGKMDDLGLEIETRSRNIDH